MQIKHCIRNHEELSYQMHQVACLLFVLHHKYQLMKTQTIICNHPVHNNLQQYFCGYFHYI